MSTEAATTALPRIPLSLVRAAAPWKRAANATTVLPDLSARVPGWYPDPGRLSGYRSVVGSSAAVPIAFPQVAVMALHLDLISQWSFPIRAMGLIHLASDVRVPAELPVEGPWEVRAWIGAGRHVRSGLEFDLCGEVLVDGEVRWASRATTLSRSRSAGGAEGSSVPDIPLPTAQEAWEEPVVLDVPEGTGRSFGRATGDVNPIHLHAVSARAFGFKRAIAHGWWTTARIAAALGVDGCSPGRRLRVVFKRPVYLPSTPTLLVRGTAGSGGSDAPAGGSAASPAGAPGRRFALVAHPPGVAATGAAASAAAAAREPAGSPTAGPPTEDLQVLVFGDVTG